MSAAVRPRRDDHELASGVTLDSVSGTARLALNHRRSADWPSTTQTSTRTISNGPATSVSSRSSGPTRTSALTVRWRSAHGQLNLAFHADSPRRLKSAACSMPLTGIGSVDGTVTGNRTELQASGTDGRWPYVRGERRAHADLVDTARSDPTSNAPRSTRIEGHVRQSRGRRSTS
jgi:hypothetical protein